MDIPHDLLLETNLQPFAYFMQTETFESAHFDERINMFHYDLSIEETLWSLTEEFWWDQAKQHGSTKSRDGRSRCGKIGEGKLRLFNAALAGHVIDSRGFKRLGRVRNCLRA